MFNYPLTRAELFLFLQEKYTHQEFEMALRYMVACHYIFNFDSFYTLKNDLAIINRRVKGNIKAAEMIGIAHKVSNLLIHFPYVKGIAISGSLSKNYAEANSDIDLFIITTKNRLWIARSLMHCFKKLTFLLNKQHYFCMNYYVDEHQLQIAEQNIYTAIEVTTLMPLHGDTVFEQFYSENSWTQNFLPNNYMRLTVAKPVNNGPFKRLLESLLNNPVGDAVDKALMRITATRWNKKTIKKRLNMHGFLLNMCAGRHCSKPDPTDFQHNLLKHYNDKVADLLLSQENSMVY
jgi:predicted nucleotidyltransferase